MFIESARSWRMSRWCFGFLRALLVLQIRMSIQGFSRQSPLGDMQLFLHSSIGSPATPHLQERQPFWTFARCHVSRKEQVGFCTLCDYTVRYDYSVSSFMGYRVSFQCSLFGARFKSRISEQRGTGALEPLLVLCRPSSLSGVSPDPVLHPPLLASRGGLIEGPGHVACFSILSFLTRSHHLLFDPGVCVHHPFNSLVWHYCSSDSKLSLGLFFNITSPLLIPLILTDSLLMTQSLRDEVECVYVLIKLAGCTDDVGIPAVPTWSFCWPLIVFLITSAVILYSILVCLSF